MLVYIIDGFNLVHKITSLQKSITPQRDLIQYIRVNKLTGSRNNKVIVVFDGKPDQLLQQQEKIFEVIFSCQRTADEIIIQRVKRMQNKSQIVVVSDDRQIRDAINAAGAKSLRTATFIKPKNKSEKNEKTKDIGYAWAHEVTEELRKIWLKDD